MMQGGVGDADVDDVGSEGGEGVVTKTFRDTLEVAANREEGSQLTWYLWQLHPTSSDKLLMKSST